MSEFSFAEKIQQQVQSFDEQIAAKQAREATEAEQSAKLIQEQQEALERKEAVQPQLVTMMRDDAKKIAPHFPKGTQHVLEDSLRPLWVISRRVTGTYYDEGTSRGPESYSTHYLNIVIDGEGDLTVFNNIIGDISTQSGRYKNDDPLSGIHDYHHATDNELLPIESVPELPTGPETDLVMQNWQESLLRLINPI